MRIAVIGAGGIGGYFGGRLAAVGEDVVFVVRGKHLEALRSHGLRVESPLGDFAVPSVEASDTPEEVGSVDVVFVAVKAWQVPEIGDFIKPLIGPSTVILPVQNGVEAAQQLAAVHGADRVLAGLCRILTMIVAPGHIRHLGVEPCIVFGETAGAPTERVKNIAAALSNAQVGVRTPSNIWPPLWEKFLFIASFGGVGAVTRSPAGTMRSTAGTREMLRAAMSEIQLLARAKGVSLADNVVDKSLAFLENMPEDATASMQRDIMEGRPSELESQNGAVVRLGEIAGVATPVHRFIYHALLPMENEARRSASASAGIRKGGDRVGARHQHRGE